MIINNYHDEFLREKLRQQKITVPEGFTSRVMAKVYALKKLPQPSINPATLLVAGIGIVAFSVFQLFVIFYLLDFFNISLLTTEVNPEILNRYLNYLMLAIEMIISYFATIQISSLTLVIGGVFLLIEFTKNLANPQRTKPVRLRAR